MTCTRQVNLSEQPYTVHIGAEIIANSGTLCHAAGLTGTALVVSDTHVHPLYGAAMQEGLESSSIHSTSVIVPAGEKSKSHTELIRIYEAALAAGLDRSSWIVALGGGVVGDLAGYAAATFLRGIRLVQVPTTLLAMVDSAVGGKTGINLPQGKNLVGVFHQPSLVIADTDTLQTLPPREFRAGLAEVIKYGVIADPDILNLLEGSSPDALAQDTACLESLVDRSCAIKADIVSKDEREQGLRAVLNFGHTLGHAIEQVTGYGTYLHGEAISMGMCYAARLSERLTHFPAESTQRLKHVLERYSLPTSYPRVPWTDIMTAMNRDKKRKAGSIGFVLANQLGSVTHGCPVSEDNLESVWSEGGV